MQLIDKPTVRKWIREDGLLPLLAKLEVEINTCAATSAAMAFEGPNASRIYSKSRSYVAGGIRHGMSQQTLLNLALELGFKVTEGMNRVTIRTKHFILHLCKLSARPALARGSMERKQRAKDHNKEQLELPFGEVPDAVAFERIVFGLIGYGFSLSKKLSLQERLSKARFVQFGIPNEEYDAYIFPPLEVKDLISDEQSVANPAPAEAVSRVVDMVKAKVKIKKQQKGKTAT